jgi:hypothetical protein
MLNSQKNTFKTFRSLGFNQKPIFHKLCKFVLVEQLFFWNLTCYRKTDLESVIKVVAFMFQLCEFFSILIHCTVSKLLHDEWIAAN